MAAGAATSVERFQSVLINGLVPDIHKLETTDQALSVALGGSAG